MEHLSSRHNPLYKRWLRLMQGKRVVTAGPSSYRVLLEGIHLCQEWLQKFGVPDNAVFNADSLSKKPELQALMAQLDHTKTYTMEAGLLRAISYVGVSQGVVFEVSITPPALPVRLKQTCLWLDRIQDPGNVGTLLRTAAAVGIHEVFMSKACAHAWSARVLRSAQGAHFSLAIYENIHLPDLFKKLEIPLYAAVLSEQAESLYDLNLKGQIAWLFGNEGQGIDPDLTAFADKHVLIPQASAVESLNVAIAASVCLFEQRRQQLAYKTP